MSKVKSITIEGVKYDSKVKAAKALVAAGKSISETAEITGIKYQSVYAYTKGNDKTQARRARYRILALGKTGKRSPGDIAKRLNVSVPMVIALLKKNGIAIVTKESLAAAKAEKAKAESVKTESVKASKSAKAKTPKIKKEKVAVVNESVNPVDTGMPVEESDDPVIESDPVAEAAAQADIATDMATETPNS